MMKVQSCYEIYMEGISGQDEAFKITKRDFIDLMEKNYNARDLKKYLQKVVDGLYDLYDVAADWAIPVIMVKALLKEYL